MANKLINVRIPENLYNESKELVENSGYSNLQEFIKDAIRNKVIQVKKDQTLINLEKNFGITKNKIKKPFNKEVKEKIALNHNAKRAKEVMKMFNL